ncbi:MAG: CPBP family intramembrane metalloprotease [Muribaculaceae bacterium]|nr:CPBP family intramembrane metalloprotease [Muribaculaceae bacterium]
MSSLTLRPGRSMMLLICIFIFMFIVSSLISSFILGRMTDTTAAIRIATVIQDLFIFVLPPLVTAVLSSRLPARWLCIERSPRPLMLFGAIAILIVAMPCLNVVVEFNKSIVLPDALRPLEEAMQKMEEAAQASIDAMMKGASVWSMIVSVLIIGILAGFSEELFFRGGFQRIMMSFKINPHLAIWVTALIFSAFHFQFYGFLPRTLLGAYFGYLVFWTRSLWIPIIVHAFNNTVVVVSTWMSANNLTKVEIDSVGVDLSRVSNVLYVIFSLLLTIIGLWLFVRFSRRAVPGCVPDQPKS